MKFKLLFGLIIFAQFISAQHRNNPSIPEKISVKIDSLINQTSPRPFSGSIIISQKSKPVYGINYTWNPIQKKHDQKLSHYLIMSNSKLFTSVLVMKQVEKGKIELNSTIKKYLPEITQSWADSVTIHQLLNHTHGIESFDKPLLFKPGTDFKYGNLSNKLLGKILENVTGKTYRELVNPLLKKAGMNSSYCFSPDENPHLISSYTLQNHTWKKVETIQISEESLPADGIVSNAHDLAKWLLYFHNGGFLKKSSYELITQPSAFSQHPVFGNTEMGYGYNIRIAEEKGVKFIGHTGLGAGFSSMLLHFPNDDLDVIVLENVMDENSEDWYFYAKEIKEIMVDYLSEN